MPNYRLETLDGRPVLFNGRKTFKTDAQAAGFDEVVRSARFNTLPGEPVERFDKHEIKDRAEAVLNEPLTWKLISDPPATAADLAEYLETYIAEYAPLASDEAKGSFRRAFTALQSIIDLSDRGQVLTLTQSYVFALEALQDSQRINANKAAERKFDDQVRVFFMSKPTTGPNDRRSYIVRIDAEPAALVRVIPKADGSTAWSCDCHRPQCIHAAAAFRADVLKFDRNGGKKQ